MPASTKEGTDMKKNYEKPVLTTEQFDVDDVITASSPAVEPHRELDPAGLNWEITGFGLN